MGTLRTLAKISEIAGTLAEGQRLNKAEKSALLSYLRNEGRDPAWADMHPGATPTRLGIPVPPLQIAAPSASDTWYRGGPSSLKLQSPVFTTRQPDAAAYYAVENGLDGVGAVGEYTVNAKQAARLRDMYRVGLESELGDAMAEYQNPLDWTYDKDFRSALESQGYDSALASDQLANGEIDALVGLSPGIFTPKARSIVTYDYNPIFGRTGKSPQPFGDEGTYAKFGNTMPWSKRPKAVLRNIRTRSSNGRSKPNRAA